MDLNYELMSLSLCLLISFPACILDVWLQPAGRDWNSEIAQGEVEIQELRNYLSSLPRLYKSFQRQSHHDCAKSVSTDYINVLDGSVDLS